MTNNETEAMLVAIALPSSFGAGWAAVEAALVQQGVCVIGDEQWTRLRRTYYMGAIAAVSVVETSGMDLAKGELESEMDREAGRLM